MENLAHIVEFLPYWSDEAAKLVIQPGRKFGRTKDDEGRQAALREHGRDSLAQIRARVTCQLCSSRRCAEQTQ